MGRFDGWLILTDLDGTLLRNDKSISEENRQAIRRFQAEGGLFSFVTGRIPQGAKAVAEVIQPNAPCGHSNGGCIYDHRIQKELWGRSVPPSAIAFAADVLAQFPSLGLIVCTHEDVYFHCKNEATEEFRCNEGFADVMRDMHTVDEPIAKIMFTTDSEQQMQALMAQLPKHPSANEVSLIRSDVSYYEILPKDACKGELIPPLSELTGVPVERIIAVGDNDNDASMLKAAGIGIAVANASNAAKAAADHVMTITNEQHAIAYIIRELEKRAV